MASKDFLETLQATARRLNDVEEGASCSQASFKVAGKAFLYAGKQGGRCKAMFRLEDSLPEAADMAASAPEDVQIGKHGWVTLRCAADKPPSARLWKRWLTESYARAAAQ